MAWFPILFIPFENVQIFILAHNIEQRAVGPSPANQNEFVLLLAIPEFFEIIKSVLDFSSSPNDSEAQYITFVLPCLSNLLCYPQYFAGSQKSFFELRCTVLIVCNS